MRYMHWGWDDLMSCPVSVFERIIAIAEEEAKERAKAEAKLKGQDI